MAASLSELPFESPAFCQISGASFGYLPTYALSADDDKVFTIIDPMDEIPNGAQAYEVELNGAD